MSVQVNCPGCGAGIEFRYGSAIVKVCPYCQSVVARGDRKVENLGKVAALVDTESPLEIGLQGRYYGQPFYITGRAQMRHAAGGIWDEWYVAFPNNKWGWLAEAQGKFYLTFPVADGAAAVPTFANLNVGSTVPIGRGVPMVVAEKGTARMVSADGEIPYLLIPGQTYDYADLSGSRGTFATLDYGEVPPRVYVGKEVTLDELGIPEKARRRSPSRNVEGQQLSCPQCGGALELRAPDHTRRVSCPNCGSLLDVTKGQLRYLEALTGEPVRPVLPMGSLGKLPEGPMTVIGMLERYVTYAGQNYYWTEYLLYEPRLGFRWLVCSDRHWSYVRPIPPGEVGGTGRNRRYQERTYKLFQKGDACVSAVVGECYWEVRVGEVVQTADYVCPPYMLSREIAVVDGAEEINWSHGTYLPPQEVEQAFGLPAGRLARPSSVGPHQPFLYHSIYPYWAILSLLAVILGVLFIGTSPRKVLYEQNFLLERRQTADEVKVFLSDANRPLEIKGWRNIEVWVWAPDLKNSWMVVAGDFYNLETGMYQPFFIPLEYYYGVDGGESWSEGNNQGSTVLSALPNGKYTLRFEVNGDPQGQPTSMHVRIRQGVPRVSHLALLLVGLSLVPGVIALYHWNFEYRRWQESDYA